MEVLSVEQRSSKAYLVGGEQLLDGSNPTPIVTPFKVILGVALTLKTSAAPGVLTQDLTYTTSGGTINIYAWKVTATGDCTEVASTEATDTVGWLAWGY